ncbi:MAG TPA: protein kinase [Polyangia bacterium]
MKFGQYELLELIATGGMAEVYRGRVVGAEGFEKFVAIKRIVPDLSEDDRFVKMLLTEARIHSGLSHRNIVQIHDLGISEGGEYFIVLEFVDGYDLRMIMEQLEAEGEIIPEALSLHIASELAQGLHFAHEQRGSNGRPLGLVHRDVSPSNVLISKAGEVKLSDFGLAKRVHDRSVVGSLKGNLGYMSPEQARQAALDRRTDIFSLGAVLFEMLTGKRLREITNEVKTWNDVAAGMIPSARAIRPDLPDGFERLLARALAPEPSGRFPTAAAFGSEIRALLSKMNMPVGASDLQALLSIINPPRKLRSLMERSKVIRLGPEVQALEEAAKRSGVVTPAASAPALPQSPRGFVVPAPNRRDPAAYSTPVIGQPAVPAQPSLTSTQSLPGPARVPPPVAPAPTPPRLPATTLSGPPPFNGPSATKRSAPVMPPISYAGPGGQSTIPGVPQPVQMTARRREITPVGWPSPPAPSPTTPPATPPSVAGSSSRPPSAPHLSLSSPPSRSPSGPQTPLASLRPAPRPPSGSMSPEALAVAATMPALHRPEPELGEPLSEDDLRPRPVGLWPPVLLGTMALLALAAVAVHFVLVPLDVLVTWLQPAALTVASDPPGADVLLDGVKLGTPTPVATSVARDRFDHVLEVSRAGYRRVHQVVRYDRARSLAFDVALQKSSGSDLGALRFVPLSPAPKAAVLADGGALSAGGASADALATDGTAASDAGSAASAPAASDAGTHRN